MEAREKYRHLLLMIKQRINSPGMINDFHYETYEILCDHMERAINKLFENGKGYLLNEEYLYYIVSNDLKNMSDYLGNIVRHLEALLKANKQDAILEVHDFCYHQYLGKYEFKYLLKEENKYSCKDIDDAIEEINKYIISLDPLYVAWDTRIKLLKKTLLYVLAYSLYENGSTESFYTYFNDITGNHLKYFDKLALSGIFNANEDFYDSHESDIFLYLKSYLDNFKMDCPEIK